MMTSGDATPEEIAIATLQVNTQRQHWIDERDVESRECPYSPEELALLRRVQDLELARAFLPPRKP